MELATTRKSPDTEIRQVAIVSPLDLNRRGGLEAYVQRLTRSLSENDIDIASTWNGQTPSDEYGFDSQWEKLGGHLLSLMTRSRTRWIARRVAESVGERRCQQWLSDVSLMHYVGTGWNLLGFPAVRAARRRGIPCTCWPAIHPDAWGDSELDFDLYRRMDAIFVQSDFERDLFAQRGIGDEQLVRCDLAPSVGGDGDAAGFVRDHRLEGRDLVLFVGRKCRQKGYHVLREAIAGLVSEGRPITLVSIGSAATEPVPELPSAADLDLGYVDDRVKADALSACDCLALPSTVESFGIVYTEAWRYSKPVLCGPAPAARELVARYGGGLACDQTVRSVRSNLESLLGDATLRRQLGDRGRDAVRHELTWGAVARRHRDTWSKLLGKPNRVVAETA